MRAPQVSYFTRHTMKLPEADLPDDAELRRQALALLVERDPQRKAEGTRALRQAWQRGRVVLQAEVLIKTGERSLLTYLLHPLTKRIAASLKEE